MVVIVAGIGNHHKWADRLLVRFCGAYLHMVADSAVSAGVVVAGFEICKRAGAGVDRSGHQPCRRLRDPLGNMGLRVFLRQLEGVTEVHDLHIWAISTSETALTAHLVMPAGVPGDKFLIDAGAALRRHYQIGHSTLQVETGEQACPQAPDQVV
jgi:cobalt-zinc-cadmium efflux system protein